MELVKFLFIVFALSHSCCSFQHHIPQQPSILIQKSFNDFTILRKSNQKNLIYDVHEKKYVKNKPKSRLHADPDTIKNVDEVLKQAAPILEQIGQHIDDVVENSPVPGNFDPMPAILSERENDNLFLTLTAALKGQIIDSDTTEWIARAMLFAACALYGTNFGTVKYLQESIPTSALCSLRFLIATIGSLPLLLLGTESISQEAFIGGLELGFYLSIGFIGQGLGLEETAASKSAFIASLAVVFVPLFESISGKKTPIDTWLTAFLAVVGVAVLQGGDVTNLTLSDMETLLQPLMFGFAFWRMEDLMAKHPSSLAPITVAQLLMVAVLTTGWSIIEGTFPDLEGAMQLFSDGNITQGMLWISLVTTVLTVFLETFSMKYLKATEVSLIFTTEPLFGAAFAAYLLGEKLDSHIWMGGAIIIFSCILSPFKNMILKKKKEERMIES